LEWETTSRWVEGRAYHRLRESRSGELRNGRHPHAIVRRLLKCLRSFPQKAPPEFKSDRDEANARSFHRQQSADLHRIMRPAKTDRAEQIVRAGDKIDVHALIEPITICRRNWHALTRGRAFLFAISSASRS
jgi:hypothetical protein